VGYKSLFLCVRRHSGGFRGVNEPIFVCREAKCRFSWDIRAYEYLGAYGITE
jgi:hypothetical protein